MKTIIILVIAIFVQGALAAQVRCGNAWKQQDVINYLNNSRIAELPLGAIRAGCNYNDSIKNRLLYHLANKWTYSQIDSIVTGLYIENLPWYYHEERLEKIVKPKSFAEYKKHKDSLEKEKWRAIYRERRSMFMINSTLIVSAGYLYIKEALPILEKALNDPDYYNSFFVKLALARLGKVEFQREIMSQNQPDDGETDDDKWMADLYKKFDILIYINTPSSIRQLANFINVTRKYEYSSGGHVAYTGFIVVSFLRDIIKNEDFLQLTKALKHDHEGIDQPNTDLLIRAKQWMVDNEGKYQIRQDMQPSLSGLL
jgi:hypothetical protein